MTKILNKRPLFFCFLAFGFGIYFAKPILSFNIITILFVLFCISAISVLCVKHKVIYSLLLILLCFLIGIGTFLISTNSFKPQNLTNDIHEIIGRVSVVTEYDNSQSLILDNVIINENKFSSNIMVYVSGNSGFIEGDIISFNETIKPNSLFTLGKFNSYYYKYNVKYSTSLSAEKIEILSTNNFYWHENLKLKVKQQLFYNLNQQEASVSYASLFGDKTHIESEIKESFSVTGIAHLLAVSGLHVGFIVTFISYILKKLKTNKYVSLGILISFLSIYTLLCNFSASIIRASIMFLVFYIAGMFGKKYDRLNAWSIAGFICLFFKPLTVYDGGFLLSFTCVLCIFMFAKPLEQKFVKLHLPKKLAGTLGVMIPIQIGLLPLISLYYSKVSIFSVLVNLICVPIFEVFFTLLFIVCIMALIMPFMGFLYVPIGFIIGGIICISNFVFNISWAIINLTAFTSIFVLITYLIMFICSHYVNLKLKTKTITSVLLVFIGAVCMILSSYKLYPQNNKVSVLNSYGNFMYCLELDNVSLAIGEFNKSSDKLFQSYLNYSRLEKVDYFIPLNNYNPKDKYYDNYYSSQTNPQNINITNTLSLKYIYYGNNFFGIVIKNDSFSVFICSNRNYNTIQCLNFANDYQNFDLVLGNDNNIKLLSNYINFNIVIQDGKVLSEKHSLNNQLNFLLSIKNKNIETIRSLN